MDSEENILVADQVDHCIQKFTEQGYLLTKVDIEGDGTSSWYPKGIAYSDSNGRVYVVSGSCVHILNSELSIYGAFGKSGSGEGQFNSPEHITCDSTGKVYVADSGNHRIQVFTAEDEFLQVITGGLESHG